RHREQAGEPPPRGTPGPARTLTRPVSLGVNPGRSLGLRHQPNPRSTNPHHRPTCRMRRPIMRMRLGAPLVVAMLGLLGAVGQASASNCGATSYGCCNQPCCDAQCCFSSCCEQVKVRYKLVWDNCLEKRWHTCYQTVQETVMKPVCKTCYREECRTCYKPCY